MFFALSSRSRGSPEPSGLPVLNRLISVIRLSVVVNVLIRIICDCHQIYPILAGRANLADDARCGQAFAYTEVKVGVVWSRVEAERRRDQHLLRSDVLSIENRRQGAIIPPQRCHMLLPFLPVEDIHGLKDAASEGFDDTRLRPTWDLVDEVDVTAIPAIQARYLCLRTDALALCLAGHQLAHTEAVGPVAVNDAICFDLLDFQPQAALL